MALKMCKRCHQVFTKEMFHNSKRYIDGKNIYCKTCSSQMRKISVKKNTEKLEKIREKNPELFNFSKKICSKCKIEKDISDFHRNRRNKDGYEGVCVECKKKKAEEALLKRLEKRGY